MQRETTDGGEIETKLTLDSPAQAPAEMNVLPTPIKLSTTQGHLRLLLKTISLEKGSHRKLKSMSVNLFL